MIHLKTNNNRSVLPGNLDFAVFQGSQPIIIALARELKKRIEPELEEPFFTKSFIARTFFY